jgi:ectoine hydroxylase
MSIALTPNTALNGTLMLVPGSHRTFVPCVGATPDDHYRASLVAQEIGTPSPAQLDALIATGGIEMPTGPAGSVVVFDCNTMHGSFDNLSNVPRINLFFVYNARSNALRAPFAAPRPRPTFIAARPAEIGVAA